MEQESNLGEPLWFRKLQERIAELEREDTEENTV